MSLDFAQALKLPFQPEYRKNLVFLSTAVMVVIGAVMMGVSFALAIVTIPIDILVRSGGGDDGNLISGMLQVFQQLIISLVQNLISIYPLGYLWQLCAHFQNPGKHPLPDWLDDAGDIFKDGLKVWLYFLLVNIVVGLFAAILIVGGIILLTVVGLASSNMLGEVVDTLQHGDLSETMTVLSAVFVVIMLFMVIYGIAFLLAGPFLLAPPIRSAQDRRLANLFSLVKAWKGVSRHYGQAILTMLLMMLMGLLYGLGTVLSIITIVGWIFLLFPGQVSMLHLLNQGLYHPDADDSDNTQAALQQA